MDDTRLTQAWERLSAQWKQPEQPVAQVPLAPPQMPVPPSKVTPPTPAPQAAAPAPTAPTAGAQTKLPEEDRVQLGEAAQMQFRPADTKYLRNQLDGAQGVLKGIEGEMKALPDQIEKAYRGQLQESRDALVQVQDKYKAALDANLTKFERDKLITRLASVAESLLYNITRFSAGIHGWNSGKDFVTGLPFNPTDWSAEMASLTAELREKNKMVDMEFGERLGMAKGELEETKKTKAEDLKTRLAGLRERYSQTGQDIRDIRGDVTGTERENIRGKAEAARFNVSERNRQAIEKARLEAETRGQDLRAEAALAKKEASEAKAAEKDAARHLQEQKMFIDFLGEAANPKNKNWADARTKVVEMLRARGMTESDVSALIKAADTESAGIFDVGEPNEGPWSTKAVSLISKAFSNLGAPPASPAAGGLPNREAIQAELARRRAGARGQ